MATRRSVTLHYERKELLFINVEGDSSVELNGEFLGNILRKHHGKLCEYFGNSEQATWLANHLYSEGLLSVPIFNAILDCPGKIISKGLLDLQRVVKNSPEKVTGLVEILKKDCVTAKLLSPIISELSQPQLLGEYMNSSE